MTKSLPSENLAPIRFARLRTTARRIACPRKCSVVPLTVVVLSPVNVPPSQYLHAHSRFNLTPRPAVRRP